MYLFVDVSGICKVVLNRKIVWEKEENSEMWNKVSGGKAKPSAMSQDDMVGMIRSMTCRECISNGRDCHVWVSGDTVNILYLN